MVFLFIYESRVYMSVGYPDDESEHTIEILRTTQTQTSNLAKLARLIYRQLKFERPRMDIPFLIQDDIHNPYINPHVREWFKPGAFSAGRAIYQTSNGFVMRELKRTRECLWIDFVGFKRFSADISAVIVAIFAARNIRKLRREQKALRTRMGGD